MVWFTLVLILVLLVVFMATWHSIGAKADYGQYSATCSLVDTHNAQLRYLNTLHEGYGPRNQHVPALDQIVTLDFQGQPTQKEGDTEGYMQIRSPNADIYHGYFCHSNPFKDRDTSRQMTLRDLLNRMLKDIPVELVDKVDSDWKFKDEPLPAPPFILQMPGFGFDNRASPEPAPDAARTGCISPVSGCALATGGFPFYNDHN